MLRFIIQYQISHEASGYRSTELYTLDIDVPELESKLRSGGYGEAGFEIHRLVGVEILRDIQSTKKGE